MKELNKKTKSVLAIYAIILIVYVLAFLIIPFTKFAASWISFAFTIIAIISSLFILKLALDRDEKLISKVYGFPVFRIGYWYVIVQLVSGILICAIAAFITVPYWMALLLCIILFAAAMIGVITNNSTRDFVEEFETKSEVETKKITCFKIDMASILDSCKNENVRKSLEKLLEAFRFSDPVSSEETEKMEARISDKIEELKALIIEGKNEEVNDIITVITNLLAERNRICKVSKK